MMEEITVTKSAVMHAEETKGDYQTVDGRLSDLIQKGIQAEQAAENEANHE